MLVLLNAFLQCMVSHVGNEAWEENKASETGSRKTEKESEYTIFLTLAASPQKKCLQCPEVPD